MVCTRHIKWGTRRRSWKWSGKSLRIRRALYYYIYNFLIWRDFCVLFFSRRPPSTHSHPPTHPPFAIDRLCCLASKNKKVFQHIFYPGTGLIKKCVLRTESLQAPPTRVNKEKQRERRHTKTGSRCRRRRRRQTASSAKFFFKKLVGNYLSTSPTLSLESIEALAQRHVPLTTSWVTRSQSKDWNETYFLHFWKKYCVVFDGRHTHTHTCHPVYWSAEPTIGFKRDDDVIRDDSFFFYHPPTHHIANRSRIQHRHDDAGERLLLDSSITTTRSNGRRMDGWMDEGKFQQGKNQIDRTIDRRPV